MVLLTLSKPALPKDRIPFTGKSVPAEPISQAVIVFELFPVTPAVENKTTPKVAEVADPKMVQLLTRLLMASELNRRVEVEIFPKSVFVIVNAFPPEFTPLITTLSAPFRSTKGPARAPVIVLKDPPEGVIERLDQAPLFKVAETVSVVFPTIFTVMFAEVCAPELMAANAELKSA